MATTTTTRCRECGERIERAVPHGFYIDRARGRKACPERDQTGDGFRPHIPETGTGGA